MKQNLRDWKLPIIVLSLGALFLYIVKDFIGLFFLAFIIATIANPIYQWLLPRVRRKMFAALITTFIVLLFVIIPLYVILAIGLSQIALFVQILQERLEAGSLEIGKSVQLLAGFIINLFEQYGQKVSSDEQQTAEFIVTILNTTTQFIANNVIPAITASIGVVLNTVIFIFLLIFMFPAREHILKYLKDISPFSAKEHNQFLSRFETITRGAFLGTITTMVVSGVVNGLMLIILGVPSAVLWIILIFFGSMIPFFAGVILLSISIYLLANGFYVEGVVLIFWSSIVSPNVDSIIQAKILNQKGQGIPELLSIISIVGGISVFGPFTGFVYGPVIAALFYTALLVYRDRKVKLKK